MSMVSRVDAESDWSERPTYEEIERAFKLQWFGTEENLGKISAIEELNPESRPYGAKPFIDLQADRSERPSTYNETECIFKPQLFDEENGEKIFNFSGESIRCLKMKALYVESDVIRSMFPENNVEYGRHNMMSSRKHGTDEVREHCIVDIPEFGNVINCHEYPRGNYNWGIMATVVEQAVAGVLANRIAAAGSDTNTISGVHFMEIAIVLGLSFKLAALALKGNRRPNLPIWMGKIGDVLTASAVILSLAMHLPPVMACTAAPLAFLVIAFAVAFA